MVCSCSGRLCWTLGLAQRPAGWRASALKCQEAGDCPPESPGRPGALCFVTSTEEWWHEASPEGSHLCPRPFPAGLLVPAAEGQGRTVSCVAAWKLLSGRSLGAGTCFSLPPPEPPSLEHQPGCLCVRIQSWLLCEQRGVWGLDPVGMRVQVSAGWVGWVLLAPAPGLALSGDAPCCPPHLDLLACVGSGL